MPHLYHGSPVGGLTVLEPQQAKGTSPSQNQMGVYTTKDKVSASLYALGKTLKGKAAFAVKNQRLLIAGKEKDLGAAYVYTVLGIWDPYHDVGEHVFTEEVKVLKEEQVRYQDFADKVWWLSKGAFETACMTPQEFEEYLRPMRYLRRRVLEAMKQTEDGARPEDELFRRALYSTIIEAVDEWQRFGFDEHDEAKPYVHQLEIPYQHIGNSVHDLRRKVVAALYDQDGKPRCGTRGTKR